MPAPDLSVDLGPGPNEMRLSFKKRIVLEHSARYPCVELAHADPDFRMNPRYISYYKLKNNVSGQRPLVAVEEVPSMEGTELEFDHMLRLNARVEEGRLELRPALTEEARRDPTAYNHLTINIKADATEAVYGCGEQFSFLNLRGRHVPLWTQEPGIAKNRSLFKCVADLAIGAGGEWWTTYYPQPTFVSSRNYFVHVESYAFADFDFRGDSRHALHVNEIPRKVVVDVQPTAPEVLASLTSYLGRQRPLPGWALDGAWLGIVGGLDKDDPNSVAAKVDRARRSNVKIAAVWAE
ncbi:MAG: hypothetical protein JW839_16560, partial [Candidatus Lokiarchaeota archaeon]|nr:hypothetical protein [Candidatus Lokiarchaeota archaeon]